MLMWQTQIWFDTDLLIWFSKWKEILYCKTVAPAYVIKDYCFILHFISILPNLSYVTISLYNKDLLFLHFLIILGKTLKQQTVFV